MASCRGVVDGRGQVAGAGDNVKSAARCSRDLDLGAQNVPGHDYIPRGALLGRRIEPYAGGRLDIQHQAATAGGIC